MSAGNLFNIEALLETINTAARVNQLLLAGIEITLTREMAGELWHVSNMDLLNCRHWSQIKEDGHVNSQFNYGFILGADEKVTIEIDGQIYE